MRAWKAHLIALSGVVLLGVLGGAGLYRTVDAVYVEHPYVSTVVGELVATTSVGQTFVAEYSGLCGVELYLATYARPNTGPLIFRLRNPSSATDLVTVVLDIAQIKDQTYQAFEFAPLDNLPGQSLYFFLEAPQSTPGNAITVGGVTGDLYDKGEAVLQGIMGSEIRDLAFRVKFCPPPAERGKIFLQRLATDKPLVFGDVNLYICLGSAYLVLLYLIILFSANLLKSRNLDN